MSKQVQIRRGTTAQTSTFAGALAEITVDTDKKTLVIHDGATLGGFPVATAREVAAANLAIGNVASNLSALAYTVGTISASGLAETAAQINSVVNSLSSQFTVLNTSVTDNINSLNITQNTQEIQIQSLATYANANTLAYLQMTVFGNGTIKTAGLNTSTIQASNFVYANGVDITTGIENYTNSIAAGINGNLGAFQNYANLQISSMLSTESTLGYEYSTLSANVGAFELYTNANVGTLYLGNISTQANLGAFQTYTNTALQTINANIGSYYNYANANIGTLYLGNISTQANLGSFYTYANTALQTINANIGAFETYSNTASHILNANIGSFYIYANTALQTINANVGAFETYANSSLQTINANIGSFYTYANTALQTINANIGSFYAYANNTIASTNANVLALGTYANNTFATGTTAATINTGLINYATYANTNIGYINANVTAANSAIATLQTQVYANANVTAYLALGTDATILGLVANTTAANSAISLLNANIGSFYTYANSSLQTINANIGSFYTYANSSLQTINANVGAYETYANTNIGYINANVTAANLNIATLQTQVYANANVAAYLPTYAGNVASANLTTGNIRASGNISSLNTLTGAVYSTGNVTTNSNLVGNSVIINAYSTQSSVFGNTNVYGWLALQQSKELYANIASPGTIANLNLNNSALFVLSGLTANFQANFQNVPTLQYAISSSLVLVQGATAYIPNTVYINGTSQTIRWQGGAAPTGTAGHVDIVGFTLFPFYGNNTCLVLGSLADYN